MKKYIDYNSLEQEAYEILCHARQQVDVIVANTIKSMIDKQPDALVRCKNCKHYMTIHCTCDGCCISDDWYCADGERKD